MESKSWIYLNEVDEATLADGVRRVTQGGNDLLALVAEADSDAIARLQLVARELGQRVYGAVVPGLVMGGGFRRRGILMVPLGHGAAGQRISLPKRDGRTSEVAIEELAAFAIDRANPQGGDTLFLLVDATILDIASLVDRLYAITGDQLNYAGSCVGSESFKRVPCVFDDQVVAEEAALAIVLKAHPGATLAHHYEGGAADRVASTAKGNCVDRIDGRPAFDVYRELMAKEYGIELDRENFYRYAVHFPFAVNRAQGEPLVRIPIQVGENGSVVCFGEIRENALLGVVRAVPPGDTSTAQAVGKDGQSAAHSSVLAFYCAGRLLHLNEEAAVNELLELERTVSPKPLYGALSLGEIGSDRQLYPAFHNATIVALPWA